MGLKKPAAVTRKTSVRRGFTILQNATPISVGAATNRTITALVEM